jgi:predicted DCC family thiol-disulfide oxidoreductase YuxK
MQKTKHIVFFDGVCTLCNASVDRLIKWDKERVLRYASLQSELAKDYLQAYFEGEAQPDSIVLYEDGKIYVKSDAVIRIGQLLGGLYSLSVVGKLLHKSIRDWMYDYVAKNRYKWFGKKETCRLPTPEEADLILG